MKVPRPRKPRFPTIRKSRAHQVPVFVLVSPACRSCHEPPSGKDKNRLEQAIARAKIKLRSTMPAALELGRAERLAELVWTCSMCRLQIGAAAYLGNERNPFAAVRLKDPWLTSVYRSLAGVRRAGLDLKVLTQ